MTEQFKGITDAQLFDILVPLLVERANLRKKLVKELANQGLVALSDGKRGSGPNPKRAKKDVNAPKKAQTGYFFFSLEQRPIILAENPGETTLEMSGEK
jgi:hypothetical protein